MKNGLAAVEHGAHHRLGLVEPAPHPGPGAPLSGMDEGDLLLRRIREGPDFVTEAPQRGGEVPAIRKDDARPAAKMAAPDARRPGEIRQVGGSLRIRRLLQMMEVPPRRRAERCRGTTGERDEAPLARSGHPGVRGRGLDSIREPGRQVARRARDAAEGPVPAVSLDDRVGVRSRKREGADGGPRRTAAVFRPRGAGRGHPDRDPVPGDVGVRLLEVDERGNEPRLHREDRLDDGGDPGRVFQVPDVRLHRAHEERTVRRAIASVHRGHRPRFDGVSEPGADPVGLQIVHLRRLDAGTAERLRHDALLAPAVRHGDGGAAAVLVHRGAPDDRQDAVPRSLGVRETPEHDHPAPLPPHVPVRPGVEDQGLPARGDHARLDIHVMEPGAERHVHSAGEGDVGIPPLEAQHRLVQRDEGRRTRGVQGNGRPFQPQHVRDPPERGAG